MVVWAMYEDGTANLEDTEAGLSFHNKHHSLVLDKTMDETWGLLQTLQDDLIRLWHRQ